MPITMFEPPAVTDSWKRVPGFKKYEINYNGQVRDHASKIIVEPVNETGVFIRLTDNLNKLRTKRVQQLRNDAFYPEIVQMSQKRQAYFPRPL